MKITIDTEFNTRAELDDFVRSRLGENSEKNIKHEIELDADDARKLSLSEETKVHGVRVVIK